MDHLQTSADESPARYMAREDTLLSDAPIVYDVEYRYPMTARKKKGTSTRKQKTENKPQNERKIERKLTRWKQKSLGACDSIGTKNRSRETRPRQVALTRGSKEMAHFCPVHDSEVLQRKQSTQKSGSLWEYYRCPVDHCFVCCGADRVECYVGSAKRQLHEFYLSKKLVPMLCYCRRPSIMSQSRSDKNPGRMFLRCSKRCCQFFQWADQKPKEVNRAWLIDGRSPPKREGYPPPQKLFKLMK